MKSSLICEISQEENIMPVKDVSRHLAALRILHMMDTVTIVRLIVLLLNGQFI